MNEMLALMEGHKSCLLFEQIFLEQMPEDIQYVCSSHRTPSLILEAWQLGQTKQQHQPNNTTTPSRKTDCHQNSNTFHCQQGQVVLLPSKVGFRRTAMSTTLHASGKRLGRPSVMAARQRLVKNTTSFTSGIGVFWWIQEQRSVFCLLQAPTHVPARMGLP